MSKMEQLWNTIAQLDLFPSVFLTVILDYCTQIEYSAKPIHIWNLQYQPHAIIFHQQLFYICHYDCVREGQIVKRNFPPFTSPTDIDHYQNCFYMIDPEKVSIFDLQFFFTLFFSYTRDWHVVESIKSGSEFHLCHYL